MKFFRSGLFVAMILVFLASIFFTIVYFQKSVPEKPTPVSPDTPTAAVEKSPETDLKTEIKPVQIVFNDGLQQIPVNELPLLSVTKKNDQIVKIEADGELAKQVIASLTLSNVKQAAPARIKAVKTVFRELSGVSPALASTRKKPSPPSKKVWLKTTTPPVLRWILQSHRSKERMASQAKCVKWVLTHSSPLFRPCMPVISMTLNET